MKNFIFMFAFLATNIASADVAPEDIFGGFLDIIQDQINKDKGGGTIGSGPGYGPGVILKDLPNNALALGRIRLDANGEGLSSFTLPKCNGGANKPVTSLRFRIDNADVYVERVRITYQNGDSEVVDVDRVYDQASVSDWYEIPGGKRCVKSITVRGNSVVILDGPYGFGGVKGYQKQFPPPGHPGWGQPGVSEPPGWSNPPVVSEPPGWANPGHPGHNPQPPGWGHPQPPPGWGHPNPPPYYDPAPAVLTFVGLKANNSGF